MATFQIVFNSCIQYADDSLFKMICTLRSHPETNQNQDKVRAIMEEGKVVGTSCRIQVPLFLSHSTAGNGEQFDLLTIFPIHENSRPIADKIS